MCLKFTLICLFISIQKSLAAFEQFDQSIPEDKTKHPPVIPVRCGLECILQCSIGNHKLNFGCFDKCLNDSPSNCKWKKTLNKDARAETQEMIENLEELHQLRNITFGELCSVPCNNETEVPEMICDLCNSVPDLPKNLTIGNICENHPCSMTVPIAAKFCDFCNFIDDIARGNGKFLGRYTLIEYQKYQFSQIMLMK